MIKLPFNLVFKYLLTHWGRVTRICVSKVSITVSDNGLSPDRRQAIIWTNVGILLIGPLGTNFSEILIEIQKFSYKKINLKISSAKWRSFCLGLNVFKQVPWQHCCRNAYKSSKWPELHISWLHDIWFFDVIAFSESSPEYCTVIPRRAATSFPFHGSRSLGVH